MGQGDDGITFFVDEMIPPLRATTLLAVRGNAIRFFERGTDDATILEAAEQSGGIVVTGDRWFYDQVHSRSPNRPSRFRRAGVIRIPGAWREAEPLLGEWLPVIEAAYRVLQDRADTRLVVAFEPGQARIVIDNDPDPTTLQRLRRAGAPLRCGPTAPARLDRAGLWWGTPRGLP